MSALHGGSVDLVDLIPSLDPSFGAAFGGHAPTCLSDNFPSRAAGIELVDPWLSSFISSAVSTQPKLLPILESQLHFKKQASTAGPCNLPTFAVPISSFTQVPWSLYNGLNSLQSPTSKKAQANSLLMTPAVSNEISQSCRGNVNTLKDKGGGQSALPAYLNNEAASFLVKAGKYGDRPMEMSKLTSRQLMEAKALAASKSHSEAERRRRERINTHLATLRGLLPNAAKTDKASLLGEVIQHVRELKRQTAEIAQGTLVPNDADELRVDTESTVDDNRVLIKAFICCDDRPGLLSDIIKALKNLKLQAVKAEMSTLGGRIKNVIVLSSEKATTATMVDVENAGLLLKNVREALQSVIESSGTGELPCTFGQLGSYKRARVGC